MVRARRLEPSSKPVEINDEDDTGSQGLRDDDQTCEYSDTERIDEADDSDVEPEKIPNRTSADDHTDDETDLSANEDCASVSDDLDCGSNGLQQLPDDQFLSTERVIDLLRHPAKGITDYIISSHMHRRPSYIRFDVVR